MKRALLWTVLFVFLVQGVFAPARPRVEAAPAQGPAEPPEPTAYRAITPPEDCNVPLLGTLGRDEEVYRGADAGNRLDYPPAWGLDLSSVNGGISTTIAAAAINTEKLVAVWGENGTPYKYHYYIWSGIWLANAQDLPALPIPAGDQGGAPAVIASDGNSWEVFVRVVDQIYTIAWINGILTSWSTVPGLTLGIAAASDPAVITIGPRHLLLFFRDTDGNIRFTERFTEGEKRVWRETPLVLSDKLQTYLPLVARGHTGAQAVPESTSRDLQSRAGPSELVAISRSENRAAVFYVDGQNRLWVNEWTDQNHPDWSDTDWHILMNNVMIEKPAVASRHVNHLAVAVRDTSGMAYIIEWTPDLNGSGTPGWKSPQALNKAAVEPLVLVSSSVDSLSVIGADPGDVNAWEMTWHEDGSWSESQISTIHNADLLTAVAMHQDHIQLLYRYLGIGVVVKQFTSPVGAPTQTEVVPDGVTKGYPRGQVLARVDGKTLLVTAHEDNEASPGYWQVDALVPGQTDPPATLVLQDSDHAYAWDSPVVMAAADLDIDGNGNDEVVLGTGYVQADGIHITIAISVLKIVTSPVLAISSITTSLIELTKPTTRWTFSLAVDDLNGDGIKNEVVVAVKAGPDTTSPIQMMVYQFNEVMYTLDLKMALNDIDPRILPSGTYYGTNVEVATGNLYAHFTGQQNPGRQIVLVNLNLYDTGFTHYYVKLYVRTYFVDTTLPGNWMIKPVEALLDTSSYHPSDAEYYAPGYSAAQILGNYMSALSTGDLDADGYDEAAMAYTNRVLTADPNAASGKVQLVNFDPATTNPAAPVDMSLAAGEVDKDGRAEILVEKFMPASPNPVSVLSRFEILGDGLLVRTFTQDLPIPGTGARLNAVLIGDIDNDSLIARLTGCGEFRDMKIVAVLNGAPRWYDGGLPINESRGTYSVSSENTTSEERGTTINLGASLSIGFEQEINIPITGVKAGEVRASITEDFMSSHGITHTTEEYRSWNTGLGFEGLSQGEVVFENVSSTCYFYDVYAPAAPQDVARAMACTPAAQSAGGPVAWSLNCWRSPACWETNNIDPGLSWADVGHRAPGGAYSNDLAIPGNYPIGPGSLPVDKYQLVYKFKPVTVIYQVQEPGDPSLQFVEWSYSTGTGGARTEFNTMDLNTIVSAGVTAFGVKVDSSVTAGVGSENSQKISWGNQLSFYGRVYHYKDASKQCYTLVPYVYQARVRTLAGATYPIWEMDYYIYQIGECIPNIPDDY